MPEDLEVGITLNTDKAIKDLESDLEDADIGTQVNLRGQGAGPAQTGGGVGAGGILEGAGILEAGSDIGTGPKKGGILGSLAGGISKTVVLLGAIVGLLALLEPVQQALGFIVRQFELLIVPAISALLPLLELLQKFAVKLIQFFRNPQAFLSNLVSGIKNALAPIANSIIQGINTIPGVNVSPVSTGQDGQVRDTGFRSAGEGGNTNTVQDAVTAGFAQTVLGGLSRPLDLYLISDDAEVEKRKQQINNRGNIGE